jgi:hypothetical protein
MQHLNKKLATENTSATDETFWNILLLHICEKHMQHPDQNTCNVRLKTDETV